MLSLSYIWIRSSQVKKKKRRNEMEGKISLHCIGMVEGGGKSKDEIARRSLVIPTPGWEPSPGRTPHAAHKPLPLLIKGCHSTCTRLPILADTHPAWVTPPPRASSDTHHSPTNMPSSLGLSVPSLCSHNFPHGVRSLRTWTVMNLYRQKVEQ